MEEKNLIPKQELSYKIVGINLAVLAVYTLLSALSPGGIIFDAFAIVVHVIVCIILTLTGPKRMQWLLSGVLVLVIGFSTCAGVLGKMSGGF
ncbi:hypothetical protein IDJ77_21470 [Mucilaginibacter sp. ZT4R22]|uniref:Uncharacterized protein n=1 Tax=Mucilaginibacter pankratovii TaxID=2772110 RepID=A0ABR7WXS3_9SPHI|nr:hypothetical protein [Mucilaginibacter pankratovii]MBD1366397.1 hypothetical protein [Mucilaginibacter pankratovii]